MADVTLEHLSNIVHVLTEHETLIAEQSRRIEANEEVLQQQRAEAKALAAQVAALHAEHERLTTALAEVRTQWREARVQLVTASVAEEERLEDSGAVRARCSSRSTPPSASSKRCKSRWRQAGW